VAGSLLGCDGETHRKDEAMGNEHSGVDPGALHEESYELGRDDARAGKPDRGFEVTFDKADRAAYEAGRSDAYKIEIPTELPPYDPNPPQASMTEITKDEARRNDEYTKEVEEARRALRGDDADMPHGEYGDLRPGEVDPATGRPVPFPTSNPGVDPAAE
jgi:hypothetical protein